VLTRKRLSARVQNCGYNVRNSGHSGSAARASGPAAFGVSGDMLTFKAHQPFMGLCS